MCTYEELNSSREHHFSKIIRKMNAFADSALKLIGNKQNAPMTEENGGTSPPKRSKRGNSPAPKLEDDVEKQNQQTFSLFALGLQRVGAQPPPKPKPQPPAQPILNARGMPVRIRKRNRFFFDDNIINDDKPSRMSLSPRKPPSITASSSVSKSVQSTPVKTPAKLLKKRKLSGRKSKPVGTKKDVPITPTKSVSSIKSASLTNVSSPAPSSKKQSLASQPPVTIALPNTSVDKRNMQRTGLRLRNLLKLPKAHRYVIFEWFYSYIDRVLFDQNDFARWLNKYFSDLKDFNLTLGEWRVIRRMTGKPRRCSARFFAEERKELERKRQKIRILQSRKSGEIKDSNFIRELPDRIPLPLPIGTKVTVRLRSTQDGVFSGTVNAFDSVSCIYRVTLNRPGLGTHSVPDYEIASENFFEMLPVRAMIKEYRPHKAVALAGSPQRINSARNLRSVLNMNLIKSDPLLGQTFIDSPLIKSLLEQESINGFPAKLLETLVRLKRLLDIKRVKVNRISDMNNDAELKISKNLTKPFEEEDDDDDNDDDVEEIEPPAISEDFQRRYASSVLTMEKINRDSRGYLNTVQAFANDLKRDPQVQAMQAPTFLRENCREEANVVVERNNRGIITNPKILQMLKHVATVLLILSKRENCENSLQVSSVLKGCLEEMMNDTNPANRDSFQKNVLQHMQHICGGILASNNMQANNSRSNE